MAKAFSELAKAVYEQTIMSKTFGSVIKKVNFISAADGKCKGELKVDEEHLNLGGTLHGGFTTTVVDCFSTYALLTHEKVGIPGVSVDLHVTFMKPAVPGDIVSIDARTIRAGRNLAFLEVELTKKEDGALIARGIHTKFVG